jgi:hypothetical protein
MNSTDKGHIPNKSMDLEATDLEGASLLVGDSYGQPLHKNPFQEELPGDLPIDQKRILLVWLLAASAMSVMMFDSAVTNADAKTEAIFFFITAGNVGIPASMLVGKVFSHRAFCLVRLYSGLLLGALVIFWTS